MHSHRTPHADFGAALSFAVSRLRGLLRTDAPAATRSPHPPQSPQGVRLIVRMSLCACCWLVATGCTYPSSRLTALPPGTPVVDVVRDFGSPREDTQDTSGWMQHTCPAGTVRALQYDS